MRILVACEESQRVTIAFRHRGHEAFSCDTRYCTGGHPEWHLQQDVVPLLQDWDMMIAFPPCTHLAVSGARHFKDKGQEQSEGVRFFMQLALAKIPRICIENPVGIMSTLWRKPDQIIQPWQFGHPETKKTCLWLKCLPPLQETNNVKEVMDTLPNKDKHRIHNMANGPLRAKLRSKTYLGIAEAMAEQWGQL